MIDENTNIVWYDIDTINKLFWIIVLYLLIYGLLVRLDWFYYFYLDNMERVTDELGRYKHHYYHQKVWINRWEYKYYWVGVWQYR